MPLIHAKRSFAEMSAAFPGSWEAEISVDQQPPGEYRVRVLLQLERISPALCLDRLLKLDFGWKQEAPTCLESLHLEFESFWDGAHFGWLNRSLSEAPLTSTDLIGIVLQVAGGETQAGRRGKLN